MVGRALLAGDLVGVRGAESGRWRPGGMPCRRGGPQEQGPEVGAGLGSEVEAVRGTIPLASPGYVETPGHLQSLLSTILRIQRTRGLRGRFTRMHSYIVLSFASSRAS